MVPQKVFFTKGVGRHKDYLQSFELALRDAGIETQNLVTVSSIFPPGCKRISKEEGVKYMKAGSIRFCVMSRNATNEPNRLIAASVGLAIPKDSNQYGYLSEHHSFGDTEEFDSNKDWDEREKQYKASGKFITTSNVTQSAQGHKDGLWTTVLASAVFILEGEQAMENQKTPLI